MLSATKAVADEEGSARACALMRWSSLPHALRRWSLARGVPTPCARHAPIRPAQHLAAGALRRDDQIFGDRPGGHAEAGRWRAPLGGLLEVLAPRRRLISSTATPTRYAGVGAARALAPAATRLRPRQLRDAATGCRPRCARSATTTSPPPNRRRRRSTGCSSTSASRRTSSTRRSAASRSCATARSTCGWTSRGGALTAATILNEWPAKEIANVIWRYGEEREPADRAGDRRRAAAGRPPTSPPR